MNLVCAVPWVAVELLVVEDPVVAPDMSLLVVSVSWDAPFTVSTDPTTFPIITIGAGGNANILHVDSIASGPAINGSNLEVTVNLTGYVYNGETATIDTIAGWLLGVGSENTIRAWLPPA